MNHAKLQKRGCRHRTGIASRRGPGTSKNFNQTRIHSSKQKKSRIESAVLKLATRHDRGWKFAGNYFPSVRAVNNFYLLSAKPTQEGGEKG